MKVQSINDRILTYQGLFVSRTLGNRRYNGLSGLNNGIFGIYNSCLLCIYVCYSYTIGTRGTSEQNARGLRVQPKD